MVTNTCSVGKGHQDMAIAPLEETSGVPATRRSGLRVVQGGRPAGAPARGAGRHVRTDREGGEEHARAVRRSRADHPTAQTAVTERPRLVVSLPPQLSTAPERRAMVRAQTLARRRRTVAVVVVLTAVTLLAMPLRALGAVTVDGRATPGAVPAGLAPGSLVTVHQGDTIRSIAMRVNPGRLAVVEHEIATSVGSTTLVPGEHVIIP
jgi:hypothetical protein